MQFLASAPKFRVVFDPPLTRPLKKFQNCVETVLFQFHVDVWTAYGDATPNSDTDVINRYELRDIRSLSAKNDAETSDIYIMRLNTISKPKQVNTLQTEKAIGLLEVLSPKSKLLDYSYHRLRTTCRPFVYHGPFGTLM